MSFFSHLVSFLLPSRLAPYPGSSLPLVEICVFCPWRPILVLLISSMRADDESHSFLDDVDRIASRTYNPSSDDVVRARLRTLGVQEYRIKVDPHADPNAPPSNGKSQSTRGALMKNMTSHLLNFGNDWLLYDVGGSRTGRHAWIPYFEGVNAIIFLARTCPFPLPCLRFSCSLSITPFHLSFLLLVLPSATT